MFKISSLFIAVFLLTSCSYIPTKYPVVIGEKVPPPEFIHGPSFKFLNWNIHKEGNSEALINDILNDKCTNDPDIVLFQEALLNTGLKYALLAKVLDWRFVPNAIKGNQYTGVLTASKAKAINTKPLIPNVTEPLLHTPKASLITEYEVRSSNIKNKLVVINVHGINFTRTSEFDKYMKYVYEEIVPFKESHAIILAGDFNTWSKKRIKKLSHYASLLKLTEVSVNNITTAKAILRILPVVTDTPLDHVFYSDNRLSILAKSTLDCVKSSDHNPIYVKFTFK